MAYPPSRDEVRRVCGGWRSPTHPGTMATIFALTRAGQAAGFEALVYRDGHLIATVTGPSADEVTHELERTLNISP